MVTTILSYLTHSQVWAVQDGPTLHVGGKTNRATVFFQNELSDMLDLVPVLEDKTVADAQVGMRSNSVPP
jgi:cytochrome c biogenesis protein